MFSGVEVSARLDSPNRRITQALDWAHPEHTVEFSVDEISELLGLAGFTDVQLRGVLVCYDSERNSLLSLEANLRGGLALAEAVRGG